MIFLLSCVLFVATVYSIPAAKRAPVELWGTCNEPSIGINGPLPCVDGSQCICKDATFSQCRQPINGVWSDNPSWQCQQPGDMPTSSNAPAAGSSGNGETGSNGSDGGVPASQNIAPSTPVESSAPSMPVSAPAASNPVSSAPSSSTDSMNAGMNAPSSNTGSTNAPSGNTGSMNAPSGNTGSMNPVMNAGQDMSSNMYSNASVTVGGCTGLTVPDGWDGVASTTYYGYMGTACMCGDGNFGQASWQANTGESLGIGQGIYSGAVNQKLFGGTLNSAGQPGCGSACGVCYELMTTGVNAYNGGTPGGSTIQMMVVDACYGAGGSPNWCSSNTDSGTDDFGCDVHFDIDTDPTQGNIPAIGQDGTTWNNGGQMVVYRRTACPAEMTDAFNQDCKSHC